jgi:hypothetical protein
MTCALVERRQTIPAPRRQGENRKHPLGDIISLGFGGVLAGCEDFVEFAEWAKGHEAFFRSFLALPQGIPAQDPFRRLFALRKPATLPAGLLPWLWERRGLAGEGSHLAGKPRRRPRGEAKQVKA